MHPQKLIPLLFVQHASAGGREAGALCGSEVGAIEESRRGKERKKGSWKSALGRGRKEKGKEEASERALKSGVARKLGFAPGVGEGCTQYRCHLAGIAKSGPDITGKAKDDRGHATFV
eukprot:2320269-Rhodomonas_salina.2